MWQSDSHVNFPGNTNAQAGLVAQIRGSHSDFHQGMQFLLVLCESYLIFFVFCGDPVLTVDGIEERG